MLPALRGGFGQQNVAKIISGTVMNLVTPKGGAKNDLLFNEPASRACILKLFCCKFVETEPPMLQNFFEITAKKV